jgi:hypothetical protein
MGWVVNKTFVSATSHDCGLPVSGAVEQVLRGGKRLIHDCACSCVANLSSASHSVC